MTRRDPIADDVFGNPIFLYWAVDEVIETLNIHPRTERALFDAAPDAYRRRVLLSDVIADLDPEAQEDIMRQIDA